MQSISEEKRKAFQWSRTFNFQIKNIKELCCDYPDDNKEREARNRERMQALGIAREGFFRKICPFW